MSSSSCTRTATIGTTRAGAAKPLLPFGKAKKRYEELQRLDAAHKRYGIPCFEGDHNAWALEVVRLFDRANPYPQTRCVLPEDAAGKALVELSRLKTDTDWTHRLFTQLNESWGLRSSWDEATKLYGALVDGTPLPLDRRETACYFAVEAESYNRSAGSTIASSARLHFLSRC